MSALSTLRSINTIPPLPEVISQINYQIHSDTGDATSLVKLIEQDLSLTSVVLKSANSVHYNFSREKIIHLRKAVVRIGRQELYNILVTVSMTQAFSKVHSAINYHALWAHSFAVSAMSKHLCKLSTLPEIKSQTNDLHTVALLHDIGILLYGCYFKERLDQVYGIMKEKKISFTTADQECYPGDSHTQLGGALLELWGMDVSIYIPVSYHHNCFSAPKRWKNHTALIQLADSIVNGINNDFIEFSTETLSDDLWLLADVSPIHAQNLYTKAEEELQQAHSLLSQWGTFSETGEASLSTLRPTGGTHLFRPV